MEEILDFIDGQVRISDQGLKATPFYVLHRGDRTEDKKMFQDAITLIYFMYSKKSLYARRSPMQRMAMISDIVLKKKEDYISKLQKLTGFEEAKNFFIEDQFTEEEWAYEQWKADVDAYLNYLRNIPYTIKTKKNQDGILVDVEIDNSATKMPAVKHFTELVELGKKLKERVKESTKTAAVGKREKKMFEDPD